MIPHPVVTSVSRTTVAAAINTIPPQTVSFSHVSQQPKGMNNDMSRLGVIQKVSMQRLISPPLNTNPQKNLANNIALVHP